MHKLFLIDIKTMYKYNNNNITIIKKKINKNFYNNIKIINIKF